VAPGLTVSKGKLEGPLTPEQEKVFTEANTLFVGAAIGILVDRLQDVYLHHTDAKKLWDALDADYSAQMLALSCTSWSSTMTTR
jgi:hypothetical protein